MATVNLDLTDEIRENLVVSALEGGSNYWYFLTEKATDILKEFIKDPRTDPISITFWQAIQAGKSIPIHELSENKEDLDGDNSPAGELLGHINLESIKKGEQLMADYHITDFMDAYNENDDANTADIWFQLCVLGEIVYG